MAFGLYIIRPRSVILVVALAIAIGGCGDSPPGPKDDPLLDPPNDPVFALIHVTGTVRSATDDAPIAGADVVLQHVVQRVRARMDSRTTSSDGSYSITPHSPRTRCDSSRPNNDAWQVVASGPGYTPQMLAVNCIADTQRADFSLELIPPEVIDSTLTPATLLQPVDGALIPQNTFTCPGSSPGYSIFFDWSDVPAADPAAPPDSIRYVLQAFAPGDTVSTWNHWVYGSELTLHNCGHVTRVNGWQWRVRVRNAVGAWSLWSEFSTFNFEPCSGC